MYWPDEVVELILELCDFDDLPNIRTALMGVYEHCVDHFLLKTVEFISSKVYSTRVNLAKDEKSQFFSLFGPNFGYGRAVNDGFVSFQLDYTNIDLIKPYKSHIRRIIMRQKFLLLEKPNFESVDGHEKMIEFINSLPNLRSLDVDFGISIGMPFWEVKTLYVNCFDIGHPDTLKSLTLEKKSAPDEVNVVQNPTEAEIRSLKFTNLKRLALINCWIDFKGDYFKYMPELSILRIEFYPSLNVHVFENFNSRNFPKLKYLSVIESYGQTSYEQIRFEDPIRIHSLVNFETKAIATNEIFLFEHCNCLESLTITRSILSHITNIEELDGLKSLDLSSNHRIAHSSGLSNLKSLQRLNMKYNQLLELEGIEDLQSLTEIDVSFNLLTSFDYFTKLASLKVLKMSNNEITFMDSIDCLVNLTHLDLSDNQIVEISDIDKCTKLEELNLKNNKITMMGPLKNLKSLKRLNLENNKLMQAEFQSLPSLQWLNLSENKLRVLPDFDHHKQLKQLMVSHNNISTIESLRDLPQLEHLGLSHNLIKEVCNISHLPNLKTLDLNNNPIEKFDILLSQFPYLETLYMGQNLLGPRENFAKDIRYVYYSYRETNSSLADDFEDVLTISSNDSQYSIDE